MQALSGQTSFALRRRAPFRLLRFSLADLPSMGATQPCLPASSLPRRSAARPVGPSPEEDDDLDSTRPKDSVQHWTVELEQPHRDSLFTVHRCLNLPDVRSSGSKLRMAASSKYPAASSPATLVALFPTAVASVQPRREGNEWAALPSRPPALSLARDSVNQPALRSGPSTPVRAPAAGNDLETDLPDNAARWFSTCPAPQS